MSNYLFHEIFKPNISNKQAFIILKNNKSISYQDFFQSSFQYANALKSMGVEKGDRVAVQVDKSPQALMIYTACISIGAVFLPLNTAYTENEVSYFINDASPKVFICKPDSLQNYIKTFNTTHVVDLNSEGNGSMTELAKNQESKLNIEPCHENDLAAILYTSGTTGRSKGAMLTHKNLVSNSRTLADLWQFSNQDTLLHALPIFHTHGLFVATNVCLSAGCSMIFLPSFSLDDLIECLPKSTVLMGVPTFYTRLLDDERFKPDSVKDARLFISGSAPLLAETHQRFYERVNHRILERYGMTETNMNASNPFDGERRPGTVGPALPGVEIKIVNLKEDKILAANETGSILVKGDNVFHGYWQMPEKTAEEFTEDGYFITGDVGFLSQDLYLTIVGRDKDLIISGGYNIYPKEIEGIIDDCEGVLESAVIGVTDKDFGEAVVALVVADNSTHYSEEKTMHSIRDNLARYKHPRKIIIIDELPRNTMGKVQKNILREQYKDVLK